MFLVRIFKKRRKRRLFAFEDSRHLKLFNKFRSYSLVGLIHTSITVTILLIELGRTCVDAFYYVFMSWD